MTELTFEQSQTRSYGRLLAAAGIAVGLGCIALAAVLVWGGWPEGLFGQIITILGIALGFGQAILLYVIHSLSLGGPVKNSKMTVGNVTVETQGD